MANVSDKPSPSLPELEAMIRSAGGYVQPTDDLRPRTLEAAGEKDARRHGRRIVVCLASLLLLLPVVGVLALPASPPPRGVTEAELHRQAKVLAMHRGVDHGWGLFQAFVSLRREQARQLGSEAFKR